MLKSSDFEEAPTCQWLVWVQGADGADGWELTRQNFVSSTWPPGRFTIPAGGRPVNFHLVSVHLGVSSVDQDGQPDGPLPVVIYRRGGHATN